jgi:sulfite reductase beta subunit-like hemoprotein
LALHGLYNWNFTLLRIAFEADASAAKAHREIKAMAESARRSIGQMTRRDNFWRRARR